MSSQKPTKRMSMGQRLAAAYLGIPVTTLNILRSSGHYKVLNIPTPLSAYHKTDLDYFRREVLACAPKLLPGDFACNDVISLHYVLQELRFRTSTGKGNLMIFILEGKIAPVGRTGDTLSEIVLKKSDVESFLLSTRAKAEGNSISLQEAAQAINCDPVILPALIAEGLLDAINVSAGRRITEKSLKDFESKYISVARLARRIGTSSLRIQNELVKNNVPVKFIERGYEKADQPFVSLEYESLMSKVLDNLTAASLEIDVRPGTAELVRQYLDRLRETGAPLPRRAGRPNKAAIAKACGFDRNALYLNPETINILDAYELEDRSRYCVDVEGSIPELRRYIGNLRDSGIPLPCRAGRPNKSYIAWVCGVDRNEFYNNADAIALLNTFD